MPATLDMDVQDALAGLRKWHLERDDSGPHRVYRDPEGGIYHSVTHILQETSSKKDKESLARWLKKPGSEEERQMAAKRGTLAHENCEYVLKTAAKIARSSANARNAWRTYEDGLERPSKAITAWALKKSIEGSPKVSWSAVSHARGLREWCADSITAIHAVEFSIHHPDGYAGTSDCLVDIGGKLTLVDFKTTGSDKDKPDHFMENYFCQAAAYMKGLNHLTGLKPKQAAIVIAKQDGSIQERLLSHLELVGASVLWDQRVKEYNGEV